MRGLGIDPSMLAQLQKQLGGKNPLEALADMASGGGGKKNPLAGLAPDLSECLALQEAMMPRFEDAITRGPGVSDLEDISRWTVIYPHYIDCERTRKQGRRLDKETCLSNPNADEMAEAATKMGLRWVLESEKCYPRDFLIRGRIRVETKDSVTQAVMYDKTTLMSLLVGVMRDLDSRKEKLAAESTEQKSGAKGAKVAGGKAKASGVKSGASAPKANAKSSAKSKKKKK